MNRYIPNKRSDLPNIVSTPSRASVQPIQYLRSSVEGREELYHAGRDVNEFERRPGASIQRRFIAWDGEGITYVKGRPQAYVLFGNSTGNYVQGKSLSTSDCLDLMIRTEQEDLTAFHVGFSFNYDVNMILRDVQRERLQRLRKEGWVRWRGYRIEWRPSKWFQVTKDLGGQIGKVTCRIWDIWGFFQGSFVKALRDFLGNRPEIQRIESGKHRRGSFRAEEIDTLIKPYWESELQLTVMLANRLRTYLYSAGLYITQWHGPGAIASYALRKNGVHQHMASCPPEVNQAAQYAYAGGRFELFQLGWYRKNVYQYDIRSAYPEAIALLPSLANGKWRQTKQFEPQWKFAVYRVRLKAPLTNQPYPLFYRDNRHCIHFPPIVEGWYWAPEVANIADWSHVEIVDGWVYEDDGTQPFAWVKDVYNQRKVWKQKDTYNPCQIALKLLLNSLYGKMAQRVGWNKKTKSAPTWHQIEWAGWVTSYTRAKLYRAMLVAGDSLIAVETDALFTTKPLPLDVGEELGQWDYSPYKEIIYLQSGFRFCRVKEYEDDYPRTSELFCRTNNRYWVAKFRGFDRESVSLHRVWRQLHNMELADQNETARFTGRTTRFVGMGLAFVSKTSDIWRTWSTTDRTLYLGRDGKRIHIPPFCQACEKGETIDKAFHQLSVSKPEGGQSVAHQLPWKDDIDYWQTQFQQIKQLDMEQ